MTATQAVLAFRDKSGLIDPGRLLMPARPSSTTCAGSWQPSRASTHRSRQPPRTPALTAIRQQIVALEEQIRRESRLGASQVKAVSADTLAKYQTLELERQPRSGSMARRFPAHPGLHHGSEPAIVPGSVLGSEPAGSIPLSRSPSSHCDGDPGGCACLVYRHVDRLCGTRPFDVGASLFCVSQKARSTVTLAAETFNPLQEFAGTSSWPGRSCWTAVRSAMAVTSAVSGSCRSPASRYPLISTRRDRPFTTSTSTTCRFSGCRNASSCSTFVVSAIRSSATPRTMTTPAMSRTLPRSRPLGERHDPFAGIVATCEKQWPRGTRFVVDAACGAGQAMALLRERHSDLQLLGSTCPSHPCAT